MVLLEVLIQEDDPEFLILKMNNEKEKKQFRNFLKKTLARAESRKNIKFVNMTKFMGDIIENISESGIMVRKKDICAVIGIIGFVETHLSEW